MSGRILLSHNQNRAGIFPAQREPNALRGVSKPGAIRRISLRRPSGFASFCWNAQLGKQPFQLPGHVHVKQPHEVNPATRKRPLKLPEWLRVETGRSFLQSPSHSFLPPGMRGSTTPTDECPESPACPQALQDPAQSIDSSYRLAVCANSREHYSIDRNLSCHDGAKPTVFLPVGGELIHTGC